MRAADVPCAPALLCLLLALPLRDCVSVPRVLQPPRATFAEGGTAVLRCRLRDGAIQDYNVLWFQQKPGLPPANVLRQGTDGNVTRIQAFGERFQAIGTAGNNSHQLQIRRVQTDDSAFYWCMVERDHFSTAACGDGTRLSVFGGRTVLKPSVILLTGTEDPSAPFTHVLCVASNFYPGVLEVTWKINGNASEATGAPFQDGAASYSLSSLLEVPARIWQRSPTVACEVRHDSSRSVITKTLHKCSSRF